MGRDLRFDTSADEASIVAAFDDAFFGKGHWLKRKLMFCGGMWQRDPPQPPDFKHIVSEVGTAGGLIGLNVEEHNDHRTVVLVIRGALRDFAGSTWRERGWENARLKDHRRNHARWMKHVLSVREDVGEEVT
jgi:hypothetical protein